MFPLVYSKSEAVYNTYIAPVLAWNDWQTSRMCHIQINIY